LIWLVWWCRWRAGWWLLRDGWEPYRLLEPWHGCSGSRKTPSPCRNWPLPHHLAAVRWQLALPRSPAVAMGVLVAKDSDA
jgi:hypothetical protein